MDKLFDILEWEKAAESAALDFYRRYNSGASNSQEGKRASVIGGGNMDTLAKLLADVTQKYAPCGTEVHIGKRDTGLPGYFRASKNWDLIAYKGKNLISLIELKSQASSYGNNFNNRCEESLGSAVDFRAAEKYETFPKFISPFSGYLFLLMCNDEAYSPVKISPMNWPVRNEFIDSSYVKRYELLCERLVEEKLYNNACLITLDGNGNVNLNPEQEIGFSKFITFYISHLIACKNLLDK